jgi:hypothetical protein
MASLSSFTLGARATAETRGHVLRTIRNQGAYTAHLLLYRSACSSKGFLVVFCARCNYTDDETVELRDWYAIPSHASEDLKKQNAN